MLELNNNEISKIDEKTFDYSSSLQKLDLSGNAIKSYKWLIKLKELSVSQYCHILEIPLFKFMNFLIILTQFLSVNLFIILNLLVQVLLIIAEDIIIYFSMDIVAL